MTHRRKRGFTLIELMVGTVIALLLTAAAVAFATQETRLMDVSQERLEMSMVGRSALALLADDLRKAGAGVGYSEAGVFLGLLADNFNAGGLGWNGSGAPSPSHPAPFENGTGVVNRMTRPRPGASSGVEYNVLTHDLGIQFADGSYATIVQERGGSGTLCRTADTRFRDGEVVMMRDAIGISARSGRLVPDNTPTTGPGCPCSGTCDTFSFTPFGGISTGDGATDVSYGFGEIQGGLATIVWFVSLNGGEGELRRAEFRNGLTCNDRRTCGGVVADFAETLLTQVWRWDTPTGTWVQAGQNPIDITDERLRVDVELILRSEGETTGPKPVATSKLRSGICIPDCDANRRDRYTRVAYRTSVEIMNSGYMKVD